MEHLVKDKEIAELLSYLRCKRICIFLEGSISTGKSTLCRSIEYYLNSMINYMSYPEPINQKLLSLYYSNIDKYAFSFQCIIIRERVRVMEEAIDYLKKSGNLTMIDRSAIGDCAFALMLYKNKKINDEEFNVYADLTKPKISSSSGIKKVIVYLNSSPEKNRERVIVRGNPEEIKNCTIEYLTELDQSYKKILKFKNCTNEETTVIKQVYESIGTTDVVYIDYDRDFDIINDRLTEKDTFMILKEIVDQIKKLE